MIKTRLQLVCCALVWEPGCLGISESWKEGVSGVGYRWTENLDWGREIAEGMIWDYKLEFNYLSIPAYIQKGNRDVQRSG